jgi:hypothetical protein
LRTCVRLERPYQLFKLGVFEGLRDMYGIVLDLVFDLKRVFAKVGSTSSRCTYSRGKSKKTGRLNQPLQFRALLGGQLRCVDNHGPV